MKSIWSEQEKGSTANMGGGGGVVHKDVSVELKIRGCVCPWALNKLFYGYICKKIVLIQLSKPLSLSEHLCIYSI